MAGKPRPLIIEVEDFRVFLMARMGTLGLTVAGMADKLGISTAATYALLSGEETPSDEIARKVGLRPAYIMDEVNDSNRDIPAKTDAKASAGKNKK
jgi:hypothetical protein